MDQRITPKTMSPILPYRKPVLSALAFFATLAGVSA